MGVATAPIKRLKAGASDPQTPWRAARITSGHFVTSRSMSGKAKPSASSVATAPERQHFSSSYPGSLSRQRARRICSDGSASLLEVGTGFHPELSGRENVFLNGAILGMSKREIESKFDEIVAFAEVGEFIDTQVKHYPRGCTCAWHSQSPPTWSPRSS